MVLFITVESFKQWSNTNFLETNIAYSPFFCLVEDRQYWFLENRYNHSSERLTITRKYRGAVKLIFIKERLNICDTFRASLNIAILLISRSLDLRNIICVSFYVRVIIVLSIFFDLQLPPLAPNIFFCFSRS